MKWALEEPAPGGIIRAKIGSVYHYGIFVSEEEVIAFGYPPVNLSAVRDEDVRVVSTDIETFCAGAFVECAVMDAREKKNAKPPEEVIRTAKGRLGEGGYSLLHNNCEHFVNECVFGTRRSDQEEKARERWNKRPQFTVFLAVIPEDLATEKVYPPARNREIFFSRNPEVRRERYAVWKLLEAAVGRCFGYDFNSLHFEKSREGKWSSEEFCFSLSHTKGACAAVVSNEPCGVDIESITLREEAYGKNPEKTGRLLDKILSAREKEEILGKTASSADFLRYWTKKESIFKAYDGKRFAPEKLDTADYSVKCFSVPELPGFMISAAGEQIPLLQVFVMKNGVPKKLGGWEYL